MEHLYGKTHLEEDMLDLTFQLSPSSYFQVNTKGAEVLYYAIIDLVEPTEDTTVLDLCCGTGGIGLCIAKVSNKAHKYTGDVVHNKHWCCGKCFKMPCKK
jgi:tRNA (uracil-5-)-methyltransferase